MLDRSVMFAMIGLATTEGNARQVLDIHWVKTTQYSDESTDVNILNDVTTARNVDCQVWDAARAGEAER